MLSAICFTRRANGALQINRLAVFWYLRISLKAAVPGRTLLLRRSPVMLPGMDFLAALVVNTRFPSMRFPRDTGFCFTRAIVEIILDDKTTGTKHFYFIQDVIFVRWLAGTARARYLELSQTKQLPANRASQQHRTLLLQSHTPTTNQRD